MIFILPLSDVWVTGAAQSKELIFSNWFEISRHASNIPTCRHLYCVDLYNMLAFQFSALNVQKELDFGQIQVMDAHSMLYGDVIYHKNLFFAKNACKVVLPSLYACIGKFNW